MPVVVSMLNSYSGWAAAGIGFTLKNPMLIITGALVGSSGAILSYIMCRAMNRSFISVILGGFGETGRRRPPTTATRPSRPARPTTRRSCMENAQKVIIVPGYGMAVVAGAARGARALRDLTKKGVEVKFAIHPVAGRMPGHMNVLLAEANIPYDVVHEMEDINSEFQQADVAYVIGANDITNPSAKTDSGSPIFGMPILDVDRAKAVFFVKRSMAPGLCRHRQPAVLHGPDHDAVRRRQEDDRGDRQATGRAPTSRRPRRPGPTEVTRQHGARIRGAGALTPTPSGVRRCGRSSGVRAPACG